ncbi:GNAT family N-acetyltransferase [Asticcacaulis solisilvae]|uniref:GNAT family N-acetyltransferase n=1 Tax=Asticcacaulis solisilvae TaxID=1217274 RepID=UPI003FD7E473
MLANADVTFPIPGLAAPSRAHNECWVTSLTTLLGPVAREEIRREMTGPAAVAARILSHAVEGFARLTGLDDAVYAGHDLLTTSLHDDVAARLAGPPPDGKALIVRSLTRHRHADILSGTLWPVRVVWIIDDPARDWLPRRDVRRDRQRLAASGLTRGHYTTLTAPQLDRVMTLYRRLYITRYSRHNPDYRPGYVRTLLADGRLEILTLERAGEIVAFCAIHCKASTLSIPMLGYDDAQPDADALYRMIMVPPIDAALARGLNVNLSAGAARFKRNRGAKPHVEYLLIRDEHLPAWRRFGYRATGWLLRLLEPKLIKVATQ